MQIQIQIHMIRYIYFRFCPSVWWIGFADATLQSCRQKSEKASSGANAALIMMRVIIVLVNVSNNSENEDDDTIVGDKKIDFRFSVSDSELNLSETILEPSRAQVMLLNFLAKTHMSLFF